MARLVLAAFGLEDADTEADPARPFVQAGHALDHAPKTDLIMTALLAERPLSI